MEEVPGVPDVQAGRCIVGDPEGLQAGVVDAIPPADVDGGLPAAPWHGGRAFPEGVYWGQRRASLEPQRQKAEIPEKPALQGAWGPADSQPLICPPVQGSCSVPALDHFQLPIFLCYVIWF